MLWLVTFTVSFSAILAKTLQEKVAEHAQNWVIYCLYTVGYVHEWSCSVLTFKHVLHEFGLNVWAHVWHLSRDLHQACSALCSLN